MNHQILLEKEQSVLRKNTVFNLEHDKINCRIPAPGDNRIDFVLCSSCFWCATYLNYKGVVIRCPRCGSDSVESLPILNGEVYTFSHNRTRGVTGILEKSRILHLMEKIDILGP